MKNIHVHVYLLSQQFVPGHLIPATAMDGLCSFCFEYLDYNEPHSEKTGFGAYEKDRHKSVAY